MQFLLSEYMRKNTHLQNTMWLCFVKWTKTDDVAWPDLMVYLHNSYNWYIIVCLFYTESLENCVRLFLHFFMLNFH